MSIPLPSFDNPPVIEVVLGVQFEPLGLTNGHLGWYWKQCLGESWPSSTDAARLPEQIEKFVGPQSIPQMPQLHFRVTPSPGVDRLQLRHANDDRMVQVQDTMFVYNWIKKEGGYPRYATLRKEFDKALEDFERFVTDAELRKPRCNQWEVTYVNHIPRATLWDTPGDWAKVFPGLMKPIQSYGGTEFEAMNGTWRSRIPPERGRLHIEARHQKANQNNESMIDVLVLLLTARGPINQEQDLDAGLNLGHETIVNTFAEIASKDAREHWGEVQHV